MAEVKASDVKALREKTGAGMMDCKKALDQSGGNFANAEKILKEMGLAAVEKRVGRATNEGRIFIKIDGQKAAMLELSCETDFVARNDEFIALGTSLVDEILSKEIQAPTEGLNAKVTELASKIRENMGLKRLLFVKAQPGEYLHEYQHGDKLAVLVRAKSDNTAAFGRDEVKTFIHDVALHIAAFRPSFLDRSKVSPDYLKEQEEIFSKQVSQDEKMKGKPEKVLEGIVKGKMSKHLADICLVDQGFVKDEKQTVAKVLEGISKAAACKLELVDFVYYRVGE